MLGVASVNPLEHNLRARLAAGWRHLKRKEDVEVPVLGSVLVGLHHSTRKLHLSTVAGDAVEHAVPVALVKADCLRIKEEWEAVRRHDER